MKETKDFKDNKENNKIIDVQRRKPENSTSMVGIAPN